MHTATLWRKIRVIPVDETFRQWIMQLHLVTKYFWSRIQRRASPTGSASPSYKIIWTSPSLPSTQDPAFVSVWLCACMHLYGCVYPSRLQNSLPSSRIAVLETTTFLEFNLLSENLLRINRLPSSLSLLVYSRLVVVECFHSFPRSNGIMSIVTHRVHSKRVVNLPSKPNLINQRSVKAALEITRSA